MAASLGARVIEKHFTISNNFSTFRDHLHSANPKQLNELSKKLKILISFLEIKKNYY